MLLKKLDAIRFSLPHPLPVGIAITKGRVDEDFPMIVRAKPDFVSIVDGNFHATSRRYLTAGTHNDRESWPPSPTKLHFPFSSKQTLKRETRLLSAGHGCNGHYGR